MRDLPRRIGRLEAEASESDAPIRFVCQGRDEAPEQAEARFVSEHPDFAGILYVVHTGIDRAPGDRDA